MFLLHREWPEGWRLVVTCGERWKIAGYYDLWKPYSVLWKCLRAVAIRHRIHRWSLCMVQQLWRPVHCTSALRRLMTEPGFSSCLGSVFGFFVLLCYWTACFTCIILFWFSMCCGHVCLSVCLSVTSPSYIKFYQFYQAYCHSNSATWCQKS